MTFTPLVATGVVLATDQNGKEFFTGTCFQFREDNVLLTAAHCVSEAVASVRILLPYQGRYLAIADIRRHPTADLAVLMTDEPDNEDLTRPYPDKAFWDAVSDWSLGEEIQAYGYPSEGPSFTEDPSPVPRLFVGHYQRFFQYTSHDGASYRAGELSIAAPGGLSGGPVFRPGAPQMLSGMVTANAESFAVTDSISQVEANGSHYREESRKVINYGVVLMLSEVADWLQETIPNPAGRSWVTPNQPSGGWRLSTEPLLPKLNPM